MSVPSVLRTQIPRMGHKQIFLPNWTIKLLNEPKRGPNHATFIVPLKINKLDLRDYLWNMYGLQTVNVRSFIQLQKITQDKPGKSRPSPRRWFRPRSVKKCIVEMERPFVFPEIGDFADWDKETFAAGEQEQEDFQRSMQPDARKQPNKERDSMREQARALLKGEEEWAKNEWENDGEEIEVERDVDVNKIER